MAGMAEMAQMTVLLKYNKMQMEKITIKDGKSNKHPRTEGCEFPWWCVWRHLITVDHRCCNASSKVPNSKKLL